MLELNLKELTFLGVSLTWSDEKEMLGREGKMRAKAWECEIAFSVSGL